LARTASGIAVMVLLLLATAAPVLAADSTTDGQSASRAAPVDLNSATVEALIRIPGIGEVMAQRIVDWREEHGPFRRAEDLIKVKGVGEKTFDKLRPYVKVGKSR
jgi:competence protein ComEA